MTLSEQFWKTHSATDIHLPTGLGPFCHPDLALLAKRILAPSTELDLRVLEIDGAPAAILPCYRESLGTMGFKWRHTGCIANLYPGRTGIIHDQKNPSAAKALTRVVLDEDDSWDQLSISVVSGSDTEAALLSTSNGLGLDFRITSEFDIPYIMFPTDWESYFGSLPKKFRYTIRSGERKLQDIGELSLRTYTNPDQCAEFLNYVEAIEKSSWKEAAKTSLTQQQLQWDFHAALSETAARAGMLRGFVLLLDQRPIAHIFGLRSGDTFCDLKESFDEDFSGNSPGAVLKALAMKENIAESITGWDFIGRAEFHKMRWTKDTYRIRTFIFFAGQKGRILRYRHDIGVLLRKLNLISETPDVFGRPD